VGDDKIRLGFYNKLGNLVALLNRRSVWEKVTDVEGNHLNTGKCTGTLCLGGAHCAKLVGLYDFVTHITVCDVANSNLVTALNTFCKCSATRNFNVVGMTSDCKYVHLD
jgi:hypothetical protein